MKKLLLTIALLAATSAQAQEKEVFDAIMAPFMKRYNAINKERVEVMQRENTPENQMLHDSLYDAQQNVYLAGSEAILAAMEEREAPFSDAFLDNVETIAGQLFYDPERYNHLRVRTERLFNNLSEEQKLSKLGKEINMDLFPFPETKVGDPLPDISLPDLDGKMHNLRTAGGGKWMLLDFWSTGCYGCIKSLPEVKAAAAKYADRLVVVGINMNDGLVGDADPAELWREDSEKDGITWLNLATPYNSELINRLRIFGRPEFYLISPEGVVVTRQLYGGYGYIDRLKEYIDGI